MSSPKETKTYPPSSPANEAKRDLTFHLQSLPGQREYYSSRQQTPDPTADPQSAATARALLLAIVPGLSPDELSCQKHELPAATDHHQTATHHNQQPRPDRRPQPGDNQTPTQPTQLPFEF